jgi:hypothetical protein
MPSAISESLKRFFFPERVHDGDLRANTPGGGLVLAHQLLSKLANQVESHAAGAPYPQIAEALHRVATEKYAGVSKLKTMIETLGEKTRIPAGDPRRAKTTGTD